MNESHAQTTKHFLLALNVGFTLFTIVLAQGRSSLKTLNTLFGSGGTLGQTVNCERNLWNESSGAASDHRSRYKVPTERGVE